MSKWQKEWWKNGRVIVKPWKMMEAQYGLDEDGCIDILMKWTKGMEEECPESRIINVEDGEWEQYSITKDMLFGPAFEWGEMIEVRDFDANFWQKEPFNSYTAMVGDGKYIVCTENTLWRQFRPIVADKVNVFDDPEVMQTFLTRSWNVEVTEDQIIIRRK